MANSTETDLWRQLYYQQGVSSGIPLPQEPALSTSRQVPRGPQQMQQVVTQHQGLSPEIPFLQQPALSTTHQVPRGPQQIQQVVAQQPILGANIIAMKERIAYQPPPQPPPQPILAYEEPKNTEEIRITHVVSPSNFCVQLNRKQTNLIALKDRMQEAYAAYVPKEPLGYAVGQLCAAQYASDQLWYRAIVKEVKGQEQFTITFVDFGNDEMVAISQLRPLPQQFANLPAQALKCSLYGAKPVSQFWVADEMSLFEQLIQCPLYARFVECDKKIYSVLLHRIDTNEILNSSFAGYFKSGPLSPVQREVENELAMNMQRLNTNGVGNHVFAQQEKPVPPPGFTVPTERAAPPVSPLGTERKVFQPAELTPGEYYPCEVVSLKSPSDFYVHLTENKRNLSNLMSGLKAHYRNNDSKSELTNPVVGMPCVAMSSQDLRWYRSLIIRILAHEKLEVFFVDFGFNEIVSLPFVKTLNPSYADVPAQALHCALGGYNPPIINWSREACDVFRSTVTVKAAYILLGSYQESLCMVQFLLPSEVTNSFVDVNKQMTKFVRFQMDGTPPPKSPASTPRQDPFRPFSVPTGKQLNIIVCHVNSPTDFYVQPTPNEATNLFKQIQDRYNGIDRSTIKMLTMSLNSVCCVFRPEDNAWYRGLIIGSGDGRVEVLYVDYGNSEYLPQEHVMQLFPEFFSYPKMAVPCSLSGVGPIGNKWTQRSIEYFESLLDEFNPGVLYPPTSGTKYKCKLMSIRAEDNDVRNELIMKDLARGIVDPDQIPPTPPRSSVGRYLSPNFSGVVGRNKVFIAHVSSPTEFWVQVYTETDDMSSLLKAIGDYVATGNLPQINAFVKDTPCLALYADNESWYRAVIVAEPSANQIKVQFVDFGNEEILALGQIRQLPAALLKYSPQGICCSLEPDVIVSSEDFRLRVLEETLVMDVVDREQSKLIVRLFQDDILLFPPRQARRAQASDFFSKSEQKPSLQTYSPRRPPFEQHDRRDINTGWGDEAAVPQAVPPRQMRADQHQASAPPKRSPVGGDRQFAGRTFERSDQPVAQSGDKSRFGAGMSGAGFRSRNEGDRPLLGRFEQNDGQPQRAAADNRGFRNRDQNDGGGFRGQNRSGDGGGDDRGFRNRDRDEGGGYGDRNQEQRGGDRGLQRGGGDRGFQNRTGDDPGFKPRDDNQSRGFQSRGESEPRRFDNRRDGGNRGFQNDGGSRGFQNDGRSRGFQGDGGNRGFQNDARPTDRRFQRKDGGDSRQNEDRSRQPRGGFGGGQSSGFGQQASTPEENWGNDTSSTPAAGIVAMEPLKSLQPVSLKLDTVYRVCLSYAESPRKFFVQMVDKEKDIVALSGKLNISAAPFGSSVSKVERGEIYVGKFPADNLWYRCEVITPKDGKATVRLVDYGNVCEIGFKNMRATDLDEPKYAFPCMLHNCPKNFTKKQADQFQKLTTGVNAVLQGKFLKIGMPCEIDFIGKAGPVSETLFGKPIAAPFDFKPHAVLPATDHECFVAHITSATEIYIHRISEEDKLDSITNLLANEYPSDQNLVPEKHLACVAKFNEDDCYYRAVILNVDGDDVTVQFIDYGNTGVCTKADIYAVKDSLRVQNAHAIQCQLVGIPVTKVGDESFIDQLSDKIIDATVTVGLKSDSPPYSVSMKTNDTDVLEQLELAVPQGPLAINYPLPDVSGDVDCFVSHANSLTDFYIQLAKDSEALDALAEKIDEAYPEGSEPSEDSKLETFFALQPVCASYDEDKILYRGVVQSVDEQVNILFVDYGNSETAPIENVRKLPESVSSQKRLAYHCRLLCEPSSDFKKFLDLTIDQPLKVHFHGQFPPYLVTIADSSGPIAERLSTSSAKLSPREDVKVPPKVITPTIESVQQAAAPVTPTEPKLQADPTPSSTEHEMKSKDARQTVTELKSTKKKVPPPVIPKGTHRGYISHFETFEEIYLQRTADEVKLEVLMGSLNDNVPPPSTSAREVGDFCIAKFADDDQWYRSQIIKIENDEATVRFIDYGNRGTSELSNLRNLSLDMFQKPAIAIRCYLPISCDCSEDTFMDTALDNELDFQFQSSSEPYRITADIEGLELTYKEIGYQPFTPPTESSPGFVSFVDSVSSFYVQLSSRQECLDKLQSDLSKSYPLKTFDVRELQVGKPCCTLYCEDHTWYRARIEKIDGNQFTVLFVDYGNKETVNAQNVFPLLDEFLDAPVFSCECSLPVNATSISEQQLDDFQDLVLASEVFIDFIPSGDTTFVDLSIDDVSLIETLHLERVSAEALAEMEVASDFELKPIPTERVQGSIVQYHSMKHFYVTLNTHDFGNCNGLASSDLETSAVCVSVDGELQRAHVLSEDGENVLVLLVDVGGIRYLPRDEIFNLPSKLMKPLVETYRCCLSSIMLSDISADVHGSLIQQHLSSEKTYITFHGDVRGFNIVSFEHDALDEFQAPFDEVADDLLRMSTYNPRSLCEGETNDVYVTQFNSFGDFWVRLVADESLFMRFENRLRLLTEHIIFDDLELAREQKALEIAEQTIEDAFDDIERLNETMKEFGCLESNLTDDSDIRAAIQNIEESVSQLAKSEFDEHLLQSAVVINDILSRIDKEDIMEGDTAGKIIELLSEQAEYIDTSCERDESSIVVKDSQIETDESCERAETSITQTTFAIEENVLESSMLLDDIISRISGLDLDSSGVDSVRGMIETIEDGLESSEPTVEEPNDSLNLSRPLQASQPPLQRLPYHLIDPSSKIIANVDGLWHRAEIIDASVTSFHVRLVDHGRTAHVQLNEMGTVPDDLANVPAFAVPCRLSIPVDGPYYPQIAERLMEMLQSDDVLRMATLSEGIPANIALVNNNCDDVIETMVAGYVVTELLDDTIVLVEQELVQQEKDMKLERASALSVDPIDLPAENEKFEVLVADVTTPNLFYCSLPGNEDDLDELLTAMNEFYTIGGIVIDQTHEGKHVAAKFSEDCQWYRAKVTAVGEEKVSVFFLDYGNTDDVPISDLRYLEPIFTELPAQIFACSLFGLEPTDEVTWSQEESDGFWDMVADKTLIASLEADSIDADDEKKYLLQLYDMGIRVAKRMAESGLGKLVVQESESVDTPITEETSVDFADAIEDTCEDVTLETADVDIVADVVEGLLRESADVDSTPESESDDTPITEETSVDLGDVEAIENCEDAALETTDVGDSVKLEDEVDLRESPMIDSIFSDAQDVVKDVIDQLIEDVFIDIEVDASDVLTVEAHVEDIEQFEDAEMNLSVERYECDVVVKEHSVLEISHDDTFEDAHEI